VGTNEILRAAGELRAACDQLGNTDLKNAIVELATRASAWVPEDKAVDLITRATERAKELIPKPEPVPARN